MKKQSRTPLWSPVKTGWRGGREVWGITWSDGTEGEYFMDPDGLVPVWEKSPEVIGFVTITRSEFVKKEDFADLFDLHLVPPGSGRDCTRSGKWFYYLTDPETCDPFPLPADAIRHGRSWCEFREVGA